MGLFSKPLARSDVQFSGLEAYANSGDEDVAIPAQVDFTCPDANRLGGVDPGALMGALGAARLLSLLRREPQYVEDFMILIKALGMGLYILDDPTSFSTRDLPMLKGGAFAPLVEADDPSVSYQEHSANAAAIGGSLPDTVDALSDPVERSTSLLLKSARHGATVDFKFKMGSANALTTIGAWAATVDECVRCGPTDRVAVPLAWGLRGLTEIWDDLGQPPGVPVKTSMQIDQGVTQLVIHYSSS